MQIQNSCRRKFEGDIRDELNKVPPKLVQIYSEIYDQVAEAGANAHRLAVTALKWLMCAEKPLATQQFIKAISMVATGKPITLKASTLLDICGNLVKIDTELDIFRFSHSSVREFLEQRSDFVPGLTNAAAAEICFNTLLAKEWLLPYVSWEKAALYEYVTLYWASHAEKSEQQVQSRIHGSKIDEQFTRDNQVAPWFAKWLLQIETASEALGHDDSLKDKIQQSLCADRGTCFFTACTFGFLEVAVAVVRADPSVIKRANS